LGLGADLARGGNLHDRGRLLVALLWLVGCGPPDAFRNCVLSMELDCECGAVGACDFSPEEIAAACDSFRGAEPEVDAYFACWVEAYQDSCDYAATEVCGDDPTLN